MKRLVANLKIYVDSEEKVEPSGARVVDIDENEFEITLRPNGDTFPGITDNITPAVLAHELGHFISYIQREKNHTALYKALYGYSDAENLAWTRAEEIFQTVKAEALRQYAEYDKRRILR